MRAHLFLIDPQNDFVEACPGSIDIRDQEAIAERTHHKPSLPVPGSFGDMERIKGFIEAGGDQISNITVSLDSHNKYDISHPSFWVYSDGKPLSDFTQIKLQDLNDGKILPRNPDLQGRCEDYLGLLEYKDRAHMVWPHHCLMGSWGHGLHYLIRRALDQWEDTSLDVPKYVLKGLNPNTEHFSAFRATSEDPSDPTTRYNVELLKHLINNGDLLAVAGEASSHCVKETFEHLMRGFNLRQVSASRIVLLTDCMSPVAGFEVEQTKLFEYALSQGVLLMKSHDLLALMEA